MNDDLFVWAESQGPPPDENTIREAFLKFDTKNPDVYRMFVHFTLEGIAAGYEEMGAGAVWERMRWETAVGAHRGDGTKYRLNNNFRAYYARKFMEEHPEHPEIFRTRKVRS